MTDKVEAARKATLKAIETINKPKKRRRRREGMRVVGWRVPQDLEEEFESEYPIILDVRNEEWRKGHRWVEK